MLATLALAAPAPHEEWGLSRADRESAAPQHRVINRGHPVINLGLPKSGSSSVQDFFKCGGLRTSHYQCSKEECGICVRHNVEAGRPPLNGCGEYDVWAQLDVDGGTKHRPWLDHQCFLPQVTHLSELHEQYPDALFVLPTRPAEHWVASVNGWGAAGSYGAMHQRFFEDCHLPGLDSALPIDAQDQRLAQFYYNHTLSVRKFMAAQSAAFLEFDIEEKEELVAAQLEDATGIPASCWGQSNCESSCNFWEDMQEIRQQWETARDKLDREAPVKEHRKEHGQEHGKENGKEHGKEHGKEEAGLMRLKEKLAKPKARKDSILAVPDLS
eukprot:Transcript_27351.p1 GENE.Transcript_27351~~Transcript_27351.p1  ORF type:complete len:327 (+),score=58.43 Transcript_27351:62-1042(+)